MGILDDLGRRHGTDKASGQHNYLNWYERYLAPWRNREFALLEIGVGGAPSLRMWRDYFQRARVIGMDNDPGKTGHASERIEIVIGDQSLVADLDEVSKLGPFGIIVDDAGHQQEAQILSHQRLLPHLSLGGIYILEDIGSQSVIEYLNRLASNVIQGNGSEIETVAFYRGTSVTIVQDDNPSHEKAADKFAQEMRDHFRRHIEDAKRRDAW